MSRSWYEHPLAQIVIARVREFTREPEAVFWVCGFPIMMVIALGLAFRNQRIEEIQVDIVGEPALVEQTETILKADKRMNVTAHKTATDGEQRLRTAKTSLLVRVIASEGTEPNYKYQYELDPTRAESVLAKSAVDDVLQRGAGRKDTVTIKEVEKLESGGRYIDFLVPGLLGMSLMGGGLWGIGFVTVDMRIRKLLKRFLGTPMKKSQFLGGLMLARLLFLLPEVMILLLFSHFVFEVRVAGSYFDVLILILLGAFSFSGIGLLVASRANTIEMVTGLMNLVMGADVDFLGHLLFARTIPRLDAAVHSSFAAHSAEQSAARGDARRRFDVATPGAAGHSIDLGDCDVCSGVEDFQMELSVIDSATLCHQTDNGINNISFVVKYDEQIICIAQIRLVKLVATRTTHAPSKCSFSSHR